MSWLIPSAPASSASARALLLAVLTGALPACLADNPRFDGVDPSAQTSGTHGSSGASATVAGVTSTTSAGVGATTAGTTTSEVTGATTAATTLAALTDPSPTSAAATSSTGGAAPTTGEATGENDTIGLPPPPVELCGQLVNGWTVEPDEVVVEVSENNSVEGSPFLTEDGLTLLFASNRDGDFNLYSTTRTSLQDPFAAPAPLDALNTSHNETAIAASGDGLVALIASNRDPGTHGGLDLWSASRPALDAPFSPPANLGEMLNTPLNEETPWMSADGLRVYYSYKSSSIDIALTARPAIDQPFAAPSALAGVNSDRIEVDPALSHDERTIIFASDRAVESLDLWVATRAEPELEFAQPKPLSLLNTDTNEFAPFLAEQECALDSPPRA